MKLYAEISKSEEQDDGTLKVWGYASSDVKDSDGETITSEALKNALPDYMKFGAVREMHGNVAAGTAIEASVQEDGKTFFGAHIVDDMAVKKVKTGVYKGFSIGGKVIERDNLNKTIIKAIKLIEVSLVDRPANPEAVFTMYKSEDMSELDNSLEINNNDKMNTEKQEEIIKSEEVVIETIKEEEVIVKSLGEISWLNNILGELVYLQSCLEGNKEWRNSTTMIPDKLKEVVKELANILVEQVAEETSKLTNEQNPDIINLSESTKDLNKAGSRNSKEDSSRIQKIHDLCLELGACSPSNITEMADKSESVDDLKKFADEKKELEESLNKALKVQEDLEKRVKEFEAMPKPAKAVLASFNKSDDSLQASSNNNIEPVYKFGTKEIDEVATAIKKSQQFGTVIRM